MKGFNRLFIIWCFVATFIFAGLCTVGFMYKRNLKKYHDFEKVIINASKSYVLKEGIVDFDGTYLDVNIDTLLNKGYILKDDMVNSCHGKVRIENQKLIKYKPLIKCKYYTSYKN